MEKIIAFFQLWLKSLQQCQQSEDNFDSEKIEKSLISQK